METKERRIVEAVIEKLKELGDDWLDNLSEEETEDMKRQLVAEIKLVE